MVIKAFIFDLGAVIVELDFSPFINEIISQSPYYKSNSNELLHKFWKETSSFDLGYMSEEEFYTHSCDFLKLTNISREKFFNAFNSVISGINFELIEYIKKLKKTGKYKIVMLSNVNPTHWDYGKRNLWNFLNIFDDLLLSFKLHMIKPDLRIFKHAIKVSSCEPKEIIYTDDREENINAARKLEINSIHYSNMNKWIKDLKTIDNNFQY